MVDCVVDGSCMKMATRAAVPDYRTAPDYSKIATTHCRSAELGMVGFRLSNISSFSREGPTIKLYE